MLEALLTAAGLVLGVVATLIGLLHENRPSTAKRALFLLALLGLGVALYTTYIQYKSREDAVNDAKDAKKSLAAIQSKVGDVAQLDAEIQSRMENLTILDKLGTGQYYVVLDTFKKGSPKDDIDFSNVRNRLLSLYPNAEANHLLWTGPAPKDPSKYELRFGRGLTPSAAEIFRRLASQGLANGNPMIKRER